MMISLLVFKWGVVTVSALSASCVSLCCFGCIFFSAFVMSSSLAAFVVSCLLRLLSLLLCVCYLFFSAFAVSSSLFSAFVLSSSQRACVCCVLFVCCVFLFVGCVFSNWKGPCHTHTSRVRFLCLLLLLPLLYLCLKA